MTDARLQALRRAAAQGGPQEQARLLQERLRVGEECRASRHLVSRTGPCGRCGDLGLKSRIELAAYCGDKAARLVVPRTCGPGFPDGGCANEAKDDCWHHQDMWPLDVWLSGLSRWGEWVLVRAACSAGWVAHKLQVSQCDWCDRTGMEPVLNHYDNSKTGRHYDQPCRDCGPARRALEACEAWLACPCEEHRTEWARSVSTMVPLLHYGINAEFAWVPVPGADQGKAALAAAQLAGEQPVRERIQHDLIEWALNTPHAS